VVGRGDAILDTDGVNWRGTMINDADTLAPEPASTPHEPLTPTQNGSEPAFLVRARRIFGGDVRPDDYLPITPEVRRRVELILQAANARGNGQPLAPELEHQQLRQELLSFHHGGQNIAYIGDDRGIIVLAVGLDQSSALIETFPDKVSGRVVFDAPWTDAVDLF
jgi:hypothetical protein